MANTDQHLTLLSDIGGTNTRVALAKGGALLPETVAKYPNAGRASLEDILREYLETSQLTRVAGACVAVAGPVSGGGTSAKMTNLDWEIQAAAVAQATGATTVSILNDLQAQGHALGKLAPDSLRPVLKGADVPQGIAALVVGVGTGFNAAPVHETPGGRYVAASECGHVALPVRTDEDFALKRYLEQKHDFASVEHACAGRGLERIHAFVTGQNDVQQNGEEVLALLQAGDAQAQRSAQIFVRLLGAAIGDLALTHLPFGGIYLIGGAARAITPWLEPFGFSQSFADKGRFGTFMAQFPIFVIEDDYAALTGCAAHISATLARR
ncbi:glucokinase [Thioclava sp. SK-1]|uniref:glucokinase n=1 Tax=Thioclava sp. SK-1 TaxID=1889770 RepID=UPI000824B503|nr:ROK family protein [Thioclava sp. SK-1]OCX62317.1 glucokinase [Thioclava sp. SK-1]